MRDRLGGVMVGVLTSSAEGRGFDPRPGQTKDFKIRRYRDVSIIITLSHYVDDLAIFCI